MFCAELGPDGAGGGDFDDPARSLLHDVPARRTGLPIALSTLWGSVGRRVGLACDGVGFPGHFLARATVDGREVFVDPFGRGQLLGVEELRARLVRAARGGPVAPSFLAPAPARQVLARMLRNLKNLYVRRRDLPRAFAAVDRLLLATPDALEERRDRGRAMQLGGPARPGGPGSRTEGAGSLSAPPPGGAAPRHLK